MRYGLTCALLCAILLCSCDSEITGSVSSGTIPRQIEDDCAMDIDIAHSDCPAIELTNACDHFMCSAATGQLLNDEVALTIDYTLPECGSNCKAMDCSTIVCDNINSYGELNVTINQDGQLGVSGIYNNEIVFTCNQRTSCGL